MTRACTRRGLIAVCLAGTIGLSATHGAAQDRAEFATYRNDRYGFAVRYPSARFLALPAATEAGRQFVSQDGNARLLVGALANFDGKSLRDYRDFVVKESYPGASIDYAPVRDKWFVISGTRGSSIFYQRVTFTCGGRVINSLAMLYPAAERGVYDRIVEQVARSYRTSEASCG